MLYATKDFLIMLKNLLRVQLIRLQKGQFKKTAETTRDWICNKITDAVTKSCNDKGKRSLIAVSSKIGDEELETSVEMPRGRYILPEKRQQIIKELRFTYI